jgi:hypothetical protein
MKMGKAALVACCGFSAFLVLAVMRPPSHESNFLIFLLYFNRSKHW